MGVLKDVGVIDDEGKVTDQAFNKYLDDVSKMLETGAGVFPPGLTCTRTVEATRYKRDLKDKEAFSEFHNIWRPRYEGMIKSLDVPGDFQLAKNGLLPLIDPTAVATVLGLSPPKLDLPGALAAMVLPGAPAMGTQQFIAAYFPDIAIDLQALTSMIAPGSDFLKILIPSPPIPPIPVLPDFRLLDFGYTEQYKFGVDLAMAPIKTHLKMMVPALMVAELPGILGKLATGDVVGGLISFVCKQVGADHPTPMSTSSLQIAAQQVLIQHQVKYQALGFVAQNIGSGVVTQGLATTPFSLGGLDIIQKPPERGQELDPLVFKGITSLRVEAIQIINSVLNVKRVNDEPTGESFYPDSGFTTIAPSYKPPLIDGADIGWDAAFDYYEVAQIMSNAGFEVRGSDGKLKTVDSYTKGPNARVAGFQTAADAAAAAEKWIKESPILAAGRNYTTCGELPGYVYSQLLERKNLPQKKYQPPDYEFNNQYYKVKGAVREQSISGRGLGGVMAAARGMEDEIEKNNRYDRCALRGTIFVITHPYALADQNFWMDEGLGCPEPGDAIISGGHPHGLGAPNSVSGHHPSHFMRRRPHGNLQNLEITHISLFYEKKIIKNVEYWFTADAGQGGKAKQGAKIKKKRIYRHKNKGIIVKDETDSNYLDGEKKLRTIIGWVNIDKVPDFKRT